MPPHSLPILSNNPMGLLYAQILSRNNRPYHHITSIPNPEPPHLLATLSLAHFDMPKHALTICTQNGMPNKASNIVIGSTTHAVTIRDGKLVIAHQGHTVFPHSNDTLLQAIYKDMDAEMVPEKEFWKIKFRKLAANAIINPLTALYGIKQNGQVFEDEKCKRLIFPLCNEIARVMKYHDMEDDWFAVASELADKSSKNTNSMLYAVMKGRRTEINFINGWYLREGKRLGVRLPTMEWIVESIKALEQRPISTNVQRSF